MNWISVNERLPEDDKKVLCYEIGNYISIMTFDLERKQFMPYVGSEAHYVGSQSPYVGSEAHNGIRKMDL